MCWPAIPACVRPCPHPTQPPPSARGLCDTACAGENALNQWGYKFTVRYGGENFELGIEFLETIILYCNKLHHEQANIHIHTKEVCVVVSATVQSGPVLTFVWCETEFWPENLKS